MSKSGKKPGMGGSDTARKIWLAGIGAYGRAFSEAQESLSKVGKESGRVFEDLVQKGQVIEGMVNAKSKDIADDVKEKMSGGIDLDLDDRIARMRDRLKRFDGGGDDDKVEARLDAIEAKLDEILARLPAKRKPAAKKATAKPSAKPAAKK